MKNIPLRIWIGLLAAVPLAVLWQTYPLASAADRIDQFPTKSFVFTSKDLPLLDVEKQIFGKAEVLKRIASVANQGTITLTIIDGTHNRHATHDPLYCFRGAGWEVTARDKIPLQKGEASFLSLKRKDSTAEAVYWFSNGKEQFSSPLQYWWQTTLRRLTLGASGPEPVLVILTNTNEQSPRWSQMLSQWQDIQML